MKTEIADHLDDDSLNDQIGAAIRRAIRYFERRRFYFNERTFNFNTAVGRETYTLADAADIAALLEIQSSYLVKDGIRCPIHVADYAAIDAMQTGTKSGTPRQWAYFAKQVLLFPIPAGVWPVTISAHVRLAELAGDDDSNAWTDDAYDLIIESAERLLAINVTQDPAAVLESDPLIREELDALLNETQLRRGRPMQQIDPALVGS